MPQIGLNEKMKSGDKKTEANSKMTSGAPLRRAVTRLGGTMKLQCARRTAGLVWLILGRLLFTASQQGGKQAGKQADKRAGNKARKQTGKQANQSADFHFYKTVKKNWECVDYPTF